MTAKVILYLKHERGRSSRHHLLNFSDVFYNLREVRSYFRDRIPRYGFTFDHYVAVRL